MLFPHRRRFLPHTTSADYSLLPATQLGLVRGRSVSTAPRVSLGSRRRRAAVLLCVSACASAVPTAPPPPTALRLVCLALVPPVHHTCCCNTCRATWFLFHAGLLPSLPHTCRLHTLRPPPPADATEPHTAACRTAPRSRSVACASLSFYHSTHTTPFCHHHTPACFLLTALRTPGWVPRYTVLFHLLLLRSTMVLYTFYLLPPDYHTCMCSWCRSRGMPAALLHLFRTTAVPCFCTRAAACRSASTVSLLPPFCVLLYTMLPPGARSVPAYTPYIIYAVTFFFTAASTYMIYCPQCVGFLFLAVCCHLPRTPLLRLYDLGSCCHHLPTCALSCHHYYSAPAWSFCAAVAVTTIYGSACIPHSACISLRFLPAFTHAHLYHHTPAITVTPHTWFRSCHHLPYLPFGRHCWV